MITKNVFLKTNVQLDRLKFSEYSLPTNPNNPKYLKMLAESLFIKLVSSYSSAKRQHVRALVEAKKNNY